MRKAKQSLNVEMVDLSTTDDPNQDSAFTAPAYVYRNGAVLLGNPSQQELKRRLDTLPLEV